MYSNRADVSRFNERCKDVGSTCVLLKILIQAIQMSGINNPLAVLYHASNDLVNDL